MPFYSYVSDDGDVQELFLLMSEATQEKEINGKKYKLQFEGSGNFILKGQGWASKGTATASSPKHGKEVGIKVDYDKKQAMKEAGEKV